MKARKALLQIKKCTALGVSHVLLSPREMHRSHNHVAAGAGRCVKAAHRATVSEKTPFQDMPVNFPASSQIPALINCEKKGSSSSFF